MDKVTHRKLALKNIKLKKSINNKLRDNSGYNIHETRSGCYLKKGGRGLYSMIKSPRKIKICK